jgi:hypothetical protein
VLLMQGCSKTATQHNSTAFMAKCNSDSVPERLVVIG